MKSSTAVAVGVGAGAGALLILAGGRTARAAPRPSRGGPEQGPQPQGTAAQEVSRAERQSLALDTPETAWRQRFDNLLIAAGAEVQAASGYEPVAGTAAQAKPIRGRTAIGDLLKAGATAATAVDRMNKTPAEDLMRQKHVYEDARRTVEAFTSIRSRMLDQFSVADMPATVLIKWIAFGDKSMETADSVAGMTRAWQELVSGIPSPFGAETAGPVTTSAPVTARSAKEASAMFGLGATVQFDRRTSVFGLGTTVQFDRRTSVFGLGVLGFGATRRVASAVKKIRKLPAFFVWARTAGVPERIAADANRRAVELDRRAVELHRAIAAVSPVKDVDVGTALDGMKRDIGEIDTIIGAYRKFLRRDPDPGGFRVYVEHLEHGRLSADEIGYVLATSREYRDRFGQPPRDAVVKMVTHLYNVVLRRDPDPGGHAHHVDEIMRGRDFETARSVIQGSDEARRVRGERPRKKSWRDKYVPSIINKALDVVERGYDGVVDFVKDQVIDLFKSLLTKMLKSGGKPGLFVLGAASIWATFTTPDQKRAGAIISKVGSGEFFSGLLEPIPRWGKKMARAASSAWDRVASAFASGTLAKGAAAVMAIIAAIKAAIYGATGGTAALGDAMLDLTVAGVLLAAGQMAASGKIKPILQQAGFGEDTANLIQRGLAYAA